MFLLTVQTVSRFISLFSDCYQQSIDRCPWMEAVMLLRKKGKANAPLEEDLPALSGIEQEGNLIWDLGAWYLQPRTLANGLELQLGGNEEVFFWEQIALRRFVVIWEFLYIRSESKNLIWKKKALGKKVAYKFSFSNFLLSLTYMF